MPPISGIEPIDTSAIVPAWAAGPTSGGASFAQSLTGAVDELRGMQSTSNELSVAAVTGDLDDIHSAMNASTRASVTLELLTAVRNKSVDAFTEIMRMQA